MRPILFICVSLSFSYSTFAVGDALLSTNLARLAPGFALGVEPHKIVDRGESQRIWEQVKYLTNFNLPIPRVEIITNRYTELGAGICFQRPDGKWADSQARFTLALDGSVQATEIPHKVRLSPELRSIGAVQMTLPDGQLMSSTFRGLYLHDTSTQKRLLVSDITNSIGTLVSSNVLVYSNCFAGLQGDLVLKVTPAGLAQDVVIRESLSWIPFDEIAFDAKSTVLEAWTEFYAAPVPDKQTNTLAARTLAEGPTEELSDQTLKFGDVLMVPGRAYLTGQTNSSIRLNAPGPSRDSVPVSKTWHEQDDGRRFLIERVRWREILPHFKRLETNSIDTAAKGGRASPRAFSSSEPPPKLIASTSKTSAILMAQAPLPESPAFVLDYTTVTCSGGICNGYRFESHETYFISGPVTILNEVVLVGGAVIKIAGWDTSAGITFDGTVKCETGPGRMVIVTCKDDNSVGTPIAQSTGDPTSDFYGYPAAFTFSYSAPPADLKYLRLSYMFQGICFANNWAYNSAWHSQFFSCWSGLTCDNTSLFAYNLLFDHVETPFQGGNCTIRGQHITARHGSDLGYDWGNGQIFLDNSLVVGIPVSSMTASFLPPSVWLTAETPSVFQTTVLGANYLAPNSLYRGIGTAAIHAELRQALKSKTTYAPVILPSSSSANMILAPAVLRNDGVNPDIGYSYDVVDYVAQGFLMEAGTLLATNGVVIGLDAGALSSGIRLAPGAKIVSEGTPVSMNRFVELRSVQEQHGSAVSAFNALEQQFSDTTGSELRLRFTDFPWRAGLGWHISRGGGPGVISLQDCQMSRGGIYGNAAGNYEYTFALTNNFFEGSQFTISGGTGTHLHIWNNTFIGGAMTLYSPNFTWNVRDNIFHQMTLYPSGSFDNDFNAYYQTTPISTGGGNKILYSPITYVPGPLGKWYLDQGSGNAPLRDGGSRTPSAAGLFHHTTHSTQEKEGSKSPGVNVDIGFHYIALKAENLARHKYATQSSTDSGRIADRAIDGNTDSVLNNGSVSQTENGNSQWWHLDLGLPEQVSTITIWNRTDCCGNLLRNFYVFVSNDPFQSTDWNATLAQPGVSAYYVAGEAGTSKSVAINRSGQYIRIQLTEPNPLSLAEVQVYPPTGPIDAEGDTLPDYFEDRDGDGTVDAGETDFKGPVVTFITPANGFLIDTVRMDMRGSVTHSSPIKSVAVNGVRAFLSGSTFDVLNIPLQVGANRITAFAEDFNGNIGSISINVSAFAAIDTIRLSSPGNSSSAGFEPLNVTFSISGYFPATVIEVKWDFDGDGTYELVRPDWAPVSHTYSAGEYFPVATVRTAIGNFSTIGGFNYLPSQGRVQITAHMAPQQQTSLAVTDPVDVKAMADGRLFVLSRSTATVTEFTPEHAVIRSIAAIGANPTGLDVDADGKVYVALTGASRPTPIC